MRGEAMGLKGSDGRDELERGDGAVMGDGNEGGDEVKG